MAAHLQHCSFKKFWPPGEALHIRKSLPSLSNEATLSGRKITLGIAESIEDADSVQWICRKAVLWHVPSSLFLSVISSAQQFQPSSITAALNATSHFWPFLLGLCPITFCISSLISQNNLSSSIPWDAKPCPAISTTGFWSLPWSRSLYQYYLMYSLSQYCPLAEFLNSLNGVVTRITFYTKILQSINTVSWSCVWFGAHVHPKGCLPSLFF